MGQGTKEGGYDVRDKDKAPKAPPETPSSTAPAKPRTRFAAATALAALALALLLTASAQAAAPSHVRREALDVTGLNHACGAAVDSKGDLYLASAGESKVNVYDPSHNLLTSINDANTPCALALTTTGNLYVSEKATGEVVRFKPNAYPFAGTPTYGSREVIDASTKAKGIAVDPFDNRLYVAEGTRVSAYDAEGNLGINEVQSVNLFEVTGGTFKLKFGGCETAAIGAEASAEEVQKALEALACIGAGNVSVTKSVAGVNKTYAVTFTGALGDTDVETIAADASGLTGGAINITETVKGWSGRIGEGVLSEASGVAPYSAEPGEGVSPVDRYLAVADAAGVAPDQLTLFGGRDVRALKLHRELTGAATPDGSFGFGAAGAYLVADPGTVKAKKCSTVGEEACTAGHLYLYDAAHKALDEFDGQGEYLDRMTSPAFADAEPTSVAIDRSGGVGDGTVYVTAGASTGAEALAFRPLLQPGRETLAKPISKELASAQAVATDANGYVYAGAGAFIHVYKPDGTEIQNAESKPLIKDNNGERDLAVDSKCNVYVLEGEATVTYYAPSACPPVSSTTYTRRATPVTIGSEFPTGNKNLKGIAVNPGPAAGKDHLFVTAAEVTREYDSAENASKLLNSEFAKGLIPSNRQSIAVYGAVSKPAGGNVYIAVNPHLIYVIDPTGKEILARIDTAVSPSGGSTGFNPYIAVDQANGHVIEYDETKTAREYEAAAGGFVAEFGNFTEGLVKFYRVAVDSACAIHEPPLTETTTPTCHEFDPANGNVYIAFDDTNEESHPPYDVTAFGPLKYKEPPAPPAPPVFELTVKRTGSGSGSVTSPENTRFASPIECPSNCSGKFEEGTKVTLEAKASEGSEFLGWSGSGCSGTGACKVTMSEAREVTAEFKGPPPKEELKVIIEPPGSGKVTSTPSGIECPSVACNFKYGKGVAVTLIEEANKGFKFLEWDGACSGTGACEVTMDEPHEVKAIFVPATYPLTVKKEGSGEGTVTSNPAGINCGGTCSHEYEFGKEVKLNQVEEAGSEFFGWGGACSGKGACEVKMEGPVEVTATYKALPQATVFQPHPIAYTEATLRGEIQTAELETEYRFEYLTQAQFEEDGESFEGAQHTPELVLAAAKAPVSVQAHLSGLEEGTAYRFRLVATNTAGMVEGEGSFTTLQRTASNPCPNAQYRTGFSANLPDCRAYELVTPAQTDGLSPYAAEDGGTDSGSFSNWLTVQRGGGGGERLSYFTSGTLPGFEGNGRRDGYRAERGAGDHPAEGWQSTLFSPNYVQSGGGQPQQLGIASDQLYSAWDVGQAEVLPGALSGGVYMQTPVGFEVLGRGSLGPDPNALSRYVSAGGAHVIFSSTAQLEPTSPPAPIQALYDRAAGATSARVLSVAPEDADVEEAAEFQAEVKSKDPVTYLGASEDGSTVAFSAGPALYVSQDASGTQATHGISPKTARVGERLSCAEGPLQGVEQANRYFQWLRNSVPIEGVEDAHGSGSTPARYETLAADAGKDIQCLVFVLEGGTGSVSVSRAIPIEPVPGAPAPQPPAQIAAPSPVNPTTGTIEACNPGSWQGATSLSYQWYVDGKPISGATAQTYEVQAGDVPGTIQCVVTGKNAAAAVARASGLQPTSPAPPEPAPVATAQAAPRTTYEGASEDGRYVFFALGDGESPGRLFRFDTQTESAAEIAEAGIFALVSSDGSHAFFSSGEAIGEEVNENGEEPKKGAHNLYVWGGAETRFVGRLAAEDFEDKTFAGIPEMDLAAWTRAFGVNGHSGRALTPTRSTLGGDVFVFQSHARLTAYDNEGVGEIYRYDPSAEAGERLLCVSCDPSGTPSADALFEDIRTLETSTLNKKSMIANLTDDGQKVFFQSFDRLLPEDVNDAEDVYEWEAKGAGGCSRPGGCLALISSGQGEGPSVLYAMSANGHDVFFVTQEKLVGADLAGSPSIYDAREEGGIPEPPAPDTCQGDACQGAGSVPPAVPTPTTSGPGEEGEVPPVRKSCAKGKHRVKGRCVASKHKHRKRHRRVRANRGGSR
jgi:hypothetical protein